MADDQTLRSKNPYWRSGDRAGAQGSSDPLAELARLIGQADPFTDIRQASARVPVGSRYPSDSDGRYRDQPGQVASAGGHAQNSGRQFEDYQDDYRADPYSISGTAAHADAYADLRGAVDDQRDAQYAQANDRSYYDPSYSHSSLDDRSYDDQTYDQQSYDQQYVSADDVHGHEQADMRADGYDQQEFLGDEVYDDPPQTRRSGALLTALTLIGCAVIGTAGAYGYRNLTGMSAPRQAPVIVADTRPNKVIPPAASNSRKPQDRVGQGNTIQANATEHLVPREEQPMVLRPPASSPPRVVLAAPVPMMAPSSVAPNHTGTADVGNRPRKVRTVPIHAGSGPTTVATVGTQTRPVAEPASAAAAETSDRAEALAPPAHRASRAQPSRSTVSHARARGAPLSLNPNAIAALTEEPHAGRLTPPAPRLASIPNQEHRRGGYVVQVSSQRSAADARASFRALQRKYPHVLGSRKAAVQRVNLGSKGVFYRAVVGPFASASQAKQLCSSLRAAGGQCIIHRD